MRTLTAGLFASIDGVVESPNLFQFDSFDPELGALMGAMIDEVDTAVLGRAGYEEWSQYWPSAPADDPFGAFINPIEKFVASTTLTGDLGWNATLIEATSRASSPTSSGPTAAASRSSRASRSPGSCCSPASSTSSR